jgi:drug/metabolite transporter (DMT)-like permease
MSLRVHLALLTVALLFSANYVIAKIGMREMAPLSFAFLRIAGAALVLWFFTPRREPLSREDARSLVVFSLLGVVINATLFLSGLAFTTVQVAAVLITTIPVFALGAAILLGHERISGAKIAGIALSAVGALLVVGGEGFAGTTRSLVGAVMIVLNCLSYAIYLVVSKPMMQRLTARRVIGRMFAVGAAFMLPISAWSLLHEEWAAISMRGWIALAVTIIGPTVIAYMLNAWALQHADSSFVAIYTYVQPILATILGALFLDETIRPIVIVAGVLIFAGVWISGRAAVTGPVPD